MKIRRSIRTIPHAAPGSAHLCGRLAPVSSPAPPTHFAENYPDRFNDSVGVTAANQLFGWDGTSALSWPTLWWLLDFPSTGISYSLTWQFAQFKIRNTIISLSNHSPPMFCLLDKLYPVFHWFHQTQVISRDQAALRTRRVTTQCPRAFAAEVYLYVDAWYLIRMTSANPLILSGQLRIKFW